MSSRSLAALPASDENEEAAVEGRGAGLAAKARCPAAVCDGPQALAGQGPLGCARATRPAGGEMWVHGLTSPWGYLGEGEPLGPGVLRTTEPHHLRLLRAAGFSAGLEQVLAEPPPPSNGPSSPGSSPLGRVRGRRPSPAILLRGLVWVVGPVWGSHQGVSWGRFASLLGLRGRD